MNIIQNINLINIYILIIGFLLGTLVVFIGNKKAENLEITLIIISFFWLVSHIYGMIFNKDIDFIFNIAGAMAIAEIAGYRSAKKLKAFVKKTKETKDLFNDIKKGTK